MTDQKQASNISQAGTSYTNQFAGEKKQVVEELAHAVGNADTPLVRATTVWPFTLYPDTLTLDRTKLTITRRNMFKAAEVQSIRVEDILSVTANVNMFFGSIAIATRFFTPEKPITVHMFNRADALRIKRIVQGYLVAKQQEIDCSKLSDEELSKILDKLGSVPAPDKV